MIISQQLTLLENVHQVGHAISSGTSYSSSVNIKVLPGGTWNNVHTSTARSLYIYTGGTVNYSSNLWTISTSFDIEDNATFNYNYSANPADATALWNGVENFRPLSNFVVKSCDNTNNVSVGFIPAAGNTTGSALLATQTYNGVTAAFGNLIFDSCGY